MLEQIISKVGHFLKDAQQKLSVESAAAVEQVYNDIVALNAYINKELAALESNSKLDQGSKKAARRGIFEQAGRKLEDIKAKRDYSHLSESMEIEPADEPVETEAEESLLQFFREKEVRDRLSSMTEPQILSFFGEALFDGSNPLLVNAILKAPAGFEPLSQATIKKIRQTAAQKTSPDMAGALEPVRNLNFMVGEIFRLVKTELDNLRRKELPGALTESKDSKDRPFKF
jgi:hypothetical protein